MSVFTTHISHERVEMDAWKALTRTHPGDVPDVSRETRQEIVDALTVNLTSFPLPGVPARRQDHLLALARYGAGFYKLPPAGIPYQCEACGRGDRLKPRMRVWTISVPWAWTTYSPCIDDLGLGERASYRLDAPVGPGRTLVHRDVVVCQACARPVREGRTALSRCAHEIAVTRGRWGRCAELVRGVHPRYCAEHRMPEAQHERERYRKATAGHEPAVGARAAKLSASPMLPPTEDEWLAQSIPLGDRAYRLIHAPLVRLLREAKAEVPGAHEKLKGVDKKRFRTAIVIEECLPDHVPGMLPRVSHAA